MTWLDAMAHTETLSVLQEAMTGLPVYQRHAVERWLLHKESKQPLLFDSSKQRQHFHNIMFRARRRLKQVLLAHFVKVDEAHFFDPYVWQ